MSAEQVPVLVIGAGPAGLSVATELAAQLSQPVVVLEREAQAGGIPRHCDHGGFGVRDLRRWLRGPAYAQLLVEKAQAAGVQIRTQTTVTGWSGSRTVEVTSPAGRAEISAGAIVLATGARERPRSARLIPGDRAAGVYTTGHLQNLVHLQHGQAGKRAVVVGSELVSWSAVMTLREAGCHTVMMVSPGQRQQSYSVLAWSGAVRYRVPVATSTRLVRIIGKERVTGVEIEDLISGTREIVECDTVVLTGDWIPENELARLGELGLDEGSRGVLVDASLRTGRPGVFAIGNLVHPVDTADVAALDGRHVAAAVREWLDSGQADGRVTKRAVEPAGPAGQGGAWPAPAVRLVAQPPLTWIAPGIAAPAGLGGQAEAGARAGLPARGRYLAWGSHYIRWPRVQVSQGGKVISSTRVWWPLAPGRVFRIPARALRKVDPSAGEASVSIAGWSGPTGS